MKEMKQAVTVIPSEQVHQWEKTGWAKYINGLLEVVCLRGVCGKGRKGRLEKRLD